MILKNISLFKKSFISLTPFVPVQNFAIRTSQATILEKRKEIPQYSREILKKMSEDRDVERLKREAEEAAQAATDKKVFENAYNDKNPSNLVKVKFNVLSQYKVQNENVPSTDVGIASTLSRPYVVLIQPRPKKMTVEGVRRKVAVRIKKATPIMREIIGKHIFDAITICANIKRKAAKYILYTLQMVKRHAVEKGLEEERLFVSEAITGKFRRFKGLRYHAKGKAGHMTRDIIQLRIKLEEKPIETMYKEIVQGKFSPALAYSMRKTMLTTDSDYETIRKYQYLITSKGRQQKRLMLKRKVSQRYMELQEKGVRLTKKVIGQKILEEEANEMAELYRAKKMSSLTNALKDRQELFKKNEENSV